MPHERIAGLNVPAIIALAFMLVWIVGGFLAYVVLDAVFFFLGGHTWTGSHALYELGQVYKWLPWIFVVVCLALTAFWTWHFWG